MFRDFNIKLGYAPTRRTDPFPDPKYAMKNESIIRRTLLSNLEKIGDVELVDIDWLNEEHLLKEPLEADVVAEAFQRAGVDALFVPHANFGCEEAVARLAKKLDVPVLLWAPMDDSFPERFTDSQCGMFATSMALSRCGVPFTYIENCRAGDAAFAEGLDLFIRAASVVKEFHHMRIGQVCQRPRAFLSVRFNEAELAEMFNIEVVAIDSTALVSTFGECLTQTEAVEARVAEIRKKTDVSEMEQEKLFRSAAAELTLERLAKIHGCNAMASQCFELFEALQNIWPCSAFGNLTERFLPVACETDVMGAISSALLQAAARGETSTFLTDLTVRHPQNENAELLWHCGVFPPSLAKEGKAKTVGMGVNTYELKPGDLTVCRFGGIGGKYRLFADEAHTACGPATDSSYVWMEVDNWRKWERKFMYGPYIHHVSVAHGRYAAALKEACRYINVTHDFVD